MINKNLIKTPNLKLSVGEPILLEDGSIGLLIKGKGQIYDTIALDIIRELAECVLNLKR